MEIIEVKSKKKINRDKNIKENKSLSLLTFIKNLTKIGS